MKINQGNVGSVFKIKWNNRFLGRIKDKCLPLSRRDMLVGSQKFFLNILCPIMLVIQQQQATINIRILLHPMCLQLQDTAFLVTWKLVVVFKDSTLATQKNIVFFIMAWLSRLKFLGKTATHQPQSLYLLLSDSPDSRVAAFHCMFYKGKYHPILSSNPNLTKVFMLPIFSNFHL